MTKLESARLSAGTGLNKPVIFKYKGERRTYTQGRVIDEVSVIDLEYKHVLQRIELTPERQKKLRTRYVIRIGYYTLQAENRKIVWGQYHSVIRTARFKRLIRKAQRKGWL